VIALSCKGESKARILIVDDHAVVRIGVRMLIDRENDMQVSGEAATGAEALARIDELKPDLAVVDLSLATGSGMDLVKDITTRYPHVRTVVLSMLSEAVYAERTLLAGAMGYVSKQDRPDALIEAIRAVLKDELYLGHAVSQQMARKMMNTGRSVPGGPAEVLTDRELQVFESLGTGFAPSEIAEALHLSVKTIGTYRERIKHKLGLTSARDLARYSVEWMRRNRP
jgi:DNA-binding NarL/FixJ family response regulator